MAIVHASMPVVNQIAVVNAVSLDFLESEKDLLALYLAGDLEVFDQIRFIKEEQYTAGDAMFIQTLLQLLTQRVVIAPFANLADRPGLDIGRQTKGQSREKKYHAVERNHC